MVLVLFGCLLSDDPANNEKDDINIEKEAKDNIEGDGNEVKIMMRKSLKFRR